jgi:hypothetical protein
VDATRRLTCPIACRTFAGAFAAAAAARYPSPALRRPPAPLAPVFALTALASISTGVVTNGIFFVTRQAYGFSDVQNYLLGVTIGASYVGGALGAGPLLARAQARWPTLRARRALALALLVLGALCALPAAFPGEARAVWALALLYAPLTGALWPIVQSFVSGGRSGSELRRTLGRFNVTWGSALVLGYWGIAPFCKDAPAAGIAALGTLHWLSLALLRWFPPEPGRAPGDAAGEVFPPGYRVLLGVFRRLLPLSTLLLNTLAPFLPRAFEQLGVPARWQTILATGWLVPRALTFLLLERRRGWHGSLRMPALGGAALLGGFALAVLAPRAPSAALGLCLELLGLVAYGVGMAVVYAGAIYYAQTVGRAGVAAGGKHEALIGAGYTLGPLLGLAAAGAVESGWLARERYEVALVVVTALAGGAFCAWAWSVARARTG